jgi:hypothetical protein
MIGQSHFRYKLRTAITLVSMFVAGLVTFGVAPADSIKVGALAPISGPGAQIGESAQIGAELAVKHINDAGGINGSAWCRRCTSVAWTWPLSPTIWSPRKTPSGSAGAARSRRSASAPSKRAPARIDTQANPTAGVSEVKRLVEQEQVSRVGLAGHRRQVAAHQRAARTDRGRAGGDRHAQVAALRAAADDGEGAGLYAEIESHTYASCRRADGSLAPVSIWHERAKSLRSRGCMLGTGGDER